MFQSDVILCNPVQRPLDYQQSLVTQQERAQRERAWNLTRVWWVHSTSVANSYLGAPGREPTFANDPMFLSLDYPCAERGVYCSLKGDGRGAAIYAISTRIVQDLLFCFTFSCYGYTNVNIDHEQGETTVYTPH